MLNEFYSPPYEITPLTMAVVSLSDEKGNFSTCIIEDQEEVIVEHIPTKIIDNACKYFGASLRGRQEGTRDICSITHKAPICIDPSSGMYYFPTISPTSPKCSWIAHSHIENIYNAANQCTEVVFKNGKKIILDVSFGSMMNQVQRTAQFRYLLDNRIKYLQKHTADTTVEPYT